MAGVLDYQQTDYTTPLSIQNKQAKVGELPSTNTASSGLDMATARDYLSGVRQGTPEQLAAANKLYYGSGSDTAGSFQATRNAGGAGGPTTRLPSQTRQQPLSNWLSDTAGMYMDDPTGHDATSGQDYGLRKEQYATREGALKIAEMLGLGPEALMSTRLGQAGGPFSGPEQWHINVDGTPHAAGMLANMMSKQPAYQVRNYLGLEQGPDAPTGIRPRNFGSGSRAGTAMGPEVPAAGGHGGATLGGARTGGPGMGGGGYGIGPFEQLQYGGGFGGGFNPFGGYGGGMGGGMGYGNPWGSPWSNPGTMGGLGQLLSLIGGYGGGYGGGMGGYGGPMGYGGGFSGGGTFGGGYGGYSPYRGFMSNLLYPTY